MTAGLGLLESRGGFSNCGFTPPGLGGTAAGAGEGNGPVAGVAEGVTGIPLQTFSSYLNATAN